jgi:subtilisin family serine protease
MQHERLLATTGASAAQEPLAAQQWWRSVVGADQVSPPGPGKPITIVDSGLDVRHEEFASRPNTALLNKQTFSADEEDHGTAVGSVVAAPINGMGLVGVYPDAVLRSWDASPAGILTTNAVVAGIMAAARQGAGVINLSFGGDEREPVIQRAILYAVKQGSLVVASSGNEGIVGNPLSYPASYPHVLTVAATNERGDVASFSSQSYEVDLAAPGVHIPVAEDSTGPNGYAKASGTSFSAPIVAGAAAWVWTLRPDLDNTQLFEVMRMSARDLAPLGFDRGTGFGILDIPRALAQAAPPPDPLEPNDDVDQVVPGGIVPGGERAITEPGKESATVSARVDRHEDPHDIYRVWVPAGRTVTARTSGGAVDLRFFPSSARTISSRPAAVSTRPAKSADTVSFRNGRARGVYAFVEVRPAPTTVIASYSLGVTTSARR